MAFGQFHGVGGRSGKPMTAMSDINVTPMVDVILVLLIIFMIAAPIMNHAIQLELPQTSSPVVATNTQAYTISFDANGVLFWNEERVNFAQLEQQLSNAVKTNPRTEILLKADKATRYEIIAQVMAVAQEKGLHNIGFVTESKVKR